jgi:DNA-binding LacI/PurR family transcriptional regulator
MTASIQQIARKVGVSKAAVSMALKGHPNISEKRRTQIRKIAEELGYHPNAAALTLNTKRTGYIGFILSDDMAGGWTNVYFSTILQGVEACCHGRGYGLHISRYNLSNIDTFVFPEKVGQRSVDGLILAGGRIEAAVVNRFREFGTPCVAIGDTMEIAGIIPSVAQDVEGGLLKAVDYAAGLGHVRIGFRYEPTPRGREVAETLIRRAKANPATAHCQVSAIDPEGLWGDYYAADQLMKAWGGLPKDKRPTLIIGNDQTLLAFLKKLRSAGFNCPQDVSLISVGDTFLCEFADPGLTAVKYDLEMIGRTAGDILIDHLEGKKPLSPASSRKDFAFELAVRDSCGVPKRD